MTPQHENELTLARILGISEDDAAERLTTSFFVKHGDGPSALLATEITALLSRTIVASGDADGADVEIVCDSTPSGRAKSTLFVRLTGEGVAISQAGISVVEDCHPLLRSIGACYASAAAMSLALGLDGNFSTPGPLIVSFSDLGADVELLDSRLFFDDAVLVGAGAVGNAFLRALRHMNVAGSLTVVDPKKVGAGNPNRCLYFDDASIGHDKATELCGRAQSDLPQLSLEPYVGTFEALVGERGKVKRVIVAVDSRRTRRSVQKELPVEVVDASTTGAEEIIIHSHRQPTNAACLACIYKHVPDELSRERDIASGLGISIADVQLGVIDARVANLIVARHTNLAAANLIGVAFDSLFKQLCSEQALLLSSGEQVLAPFAFVSELAGALLVIESARLDRDGGKFDFTNYFFTNPWRAPNKRARKRRPRAQDCEFCSVAISFDAMRLVWPELFGDNTATGE